MADHDDESSNEGLFSDNEVVDGSSTSKCSNEEAANSSSDSETLDSCNIETSTTGINLEVALEIYHEDLYADITFTPWKHAYTHVL